MLTVVGEMPLTPMFNLDKAARVTSPRSEKVVSIRYLLT